MPVHLTLSNSKADRFERIKEELAEDLGFTPSNPEVIGILMASLDLNDLGHEHDSQTGNDIGTPRS